MDKDLNISTTFRPRLVAIVGAGKQDKLADYLTQRHGVMAIDIGTFTRKLAEAAAADMRPLRYDVSAKSVADYGSPHLMLRVVSELFAGDPDTPGALVLSGVRTPAEAAVLKRNFGSDLLVIFIKDTNSPEPATNTTHDDVALEVGSDKAREALVANQADLVFWDQDPTVDVYQVVENKIVPHLFP